MHTTVKYQKHLSYAKWSPEWIIHTERFRLRRISLFTTDNHFSKYYEHHRQIPVLPMKSDGCLIWNWQRKIKTCTTYISNEWLTFIIIRQSFKKKVIFVISTLNSITLYSLRIEKWQKFVSIPLVDRSGEKIEFG
jgi:hypothetical protein